jgi:hypothetical protein
MFLSRRRDAMQQVIDNPPKSAVQLDEAIALSLLKQMWELIEIGLQTDFEDADEPPPPPMIMPTFVPGNMTLH